MYKNEHGVEFDFAELDRCTALTVGLTLEVKTLSKITVFVVLFCFFDDSRHLQKSVRSKDYEADFCFPTSLYESHYSRTAATETIFEMQHEKRVCVLGIHTIHFYPRVM